MGMFKSLFNYVKAKTNLEGLSLRLYVDSDNNRAIEVYKRLGMNHANFQFLEIDFAFSE